jgi:hypothetical protein
MRFPAHTNSYECRTKEELVQRACQMGLPAIKAQQLTKSALIQVLRQYRKSPQSAHRSLSQRLSAKRRSKSKSKSR